MKPTSNHKLFNSPIVLLSIVFIYLVYGFTQTSQSDSHKPTINVWHGDIQRVGHLGRAQEDFNLMGELSGFTYPVELTCFTGNQSILLNVGQRNDGFGNGRRLARTGHFNADIHIKNLIPGKNKIQLIARDTEGSQVNKTVTLIKESGSYPLPVRIDWSEIEDPQSVGQYVDGHWAIDEKGLRTQHTGYDRIFLIGETSWQSYEITLPVTIHAIDEETGPVSSGHGVGLLFYFQGHVIGGPRNFPPSQPKWGYQPFGSIYWLRWKKNRSERTPRIQFYHGDSNEQHYFDEFPIEWGGTYWMKAQCQNQQPSEKGWGVTIYRYKTWPFDKPEPDEWNLEYTQTSEHALQSGGVALLAHHVDASFGNIHIKAFESSP